MDILTLLGLFLGIAAILVGQHLEGGSISMLLNPAAMMIVLGGTMGAIMLQSTLNTFIRAIQILVWVIWP
ncbi:MAG: flagellar motor protein, partial [Gammaproteobacteria bacterium]|nr:flagellar motor protein [Gammaproteobacteria bacterium]